MDPFHEFADHHAYLLDNSRDNILNIMKNILAFNDVSKVPNDIFKSEEQYQEFSYELEHFCEN